MKEEENKGEHHVHEEEEQKKAMKCGTMTSSTNPSAACRTFWMAGQPLDPMVAQMKGDAPGGGEMQRAPRRRLRDGRTCLECKKSKVRGQSWVSAGGGDANSRSGRLKPTSRRRCGGAIVYTDVLKERMLLAPLREGLSHTLSLHIKENFSCLDPLFFLFPCQFLFFLLPLSLPLPFLSLPIFSRPGFFFRSFLFLPRFQRLSWLSFCLTPPSLPPLLLGHLVLFPGQVRQKAALLYPVCAQQS